MKKEERQNQIRKMLNSTGSVTVSEIMNALCVSDMTVRRDLTEMAEQGILIRTHGGAQRILSEDDGLERSHQEKKRLQEAEKNAIAKTAASFIPDGETIFLGLGTTMELLAGCLKHRTMRIVTNSLPVFEILRFSKTVDLLLVGGEYRSITGAFVGMISVQAIQNMRFSRVFISANGIVDNSVYTYSEAEGEVQKTALNNANRKYLVTDASKFGRYDFYEFCKVSDFDHIITDDGADDDTLRHLRTLSDVIIAS